LKHPQQQPQHLGSSSHHRMNSNEAAAATASKCVVMAKLPAPVVAAMPAAALMVEQEVAVAAVAAVAVGQGSKWQRHQRQQCRRHCGRQQRWEISKRRSGRQQPPVCPVSRLPNAAASATAAETGSTDAALAPDPQAAACPPTALQRKPRP